ncbi:MAG: hypothetical protein FKY71_06255 [Spiribacter salinus]|uniref:Uncharacterized protein n=1 Tax=Spiribacter salinus TaxID=1335746 RepID=A0A540VSZ7_9GAMM|nr:MAG: hypothetical protein FKY71_06255 [Spiribacter salinus]
MAVSVSDRISQDHFELISMHLLHLRFAPGATLFEVPVSEALPLFNVQAIGPDKVVKSPDWMQCPVKRMT